MATTQQARHKLPSNLRANIKQTSKKRRQKSAGVKPFAQITQGLKPYMGQ